MKQITELSEAEVLQLTTDQIQKMILFKMAEAGIKILTKPVEPDYQPLPAKDIEFYSIDGLSYITDNKDIAEKIGLMLKTHVADLRNYTYAGNDYNIKTVKVIDEYSQNTIGSVKLDLYYSQLNAGKVTEISKTNKALKTEYDALLSEFKQNEEQADYIRVEIWDRIKTVQAKHNNMSEMKYQYDRYLDLSEGNKKIALNFLKKAYSIDEETECFVQGKEYHEVIEEGYQTTAKSEGQAN